MCCGKSRRSARPEAGGFHFSVRMRERKRAAVYDVGRQSLAILRRQGETGMHGE